MVRLKKIIFFVISLTILLAGNAGANVKRTLDKAVDQVCGQAAEQLKATQIKDINTVAVLPLWGEDKDGYVLDTVKSYLSNSPYKIMVRSTEEWDKLLGEIKWNTLREDIMNPQTVQSFGKIEGCDAIVYGTVRQREVNPWTFHAIARMTLHMADVETGQIAWSSKPVTASVWLEWPEMLQLAVYHPVVWVVAGLIVLSIVWVSFKKLIRTATRPR
ncbi:MAG: hypothetical protein WC496_03780 [Phycisphaerae bacterium]|jgi:hypothetical protein